MPARPHQIAAKTAVLSDYDAGYRHLAVSMATGTGKTFFFSELYEELRSRLPGKMLVLVHTEELVDQNLKALRKMYPELKIDKEMSRFKAEPKTADIIVASVASLGRKGTPRVDKYDWSEWDKIIIDEAHHTPAQSYRNVLEHAGVLQPDSDKLLLGVTATTRRSDGKALSDFFSRISYVYSLQQAIQDGWLVDIRGYRVNTETNLDSVGKSNGDFDASELADKVNNAERNFKIVDAWEKLGEKRQTVIFAADRAHAKALADAFKSRGISCEAISYDDPDRGQKLLDHQNKKTTIIVNVGILTEGYDDPNIGCIVIARPTQSECLFTQMCGRGTRLEEGTGNLKTQVSTPEENVKKDCIIIDVVDATSVHTLMTVPTLMGLPGCMDLHGGSAVETKAQLDALQEQFPNIDFSKLEDIKNAESYVEQINMFEIRFPAEVEANSELTWCKTVDGAYRISVPGPAINQVGEPIKRGPGGQVTISKNLLGKWEIDGKIKDEKFHGERATMEDAFVTADNAIRERAGQLMSFMNRKASWFGQPLKPGSSQDKLLRRLYPGKAWPVDLTKGQASFWIDKKMSRRKK